MHQSQRLAESLISIAERAGAAIMQIYGAGFTVQHKEDDSPLTLADLESQRIILDGLKQLTPDIPILSEESAAAPWAERQSWRELWVVDPLDGTREFIKRNGEFTVNIALVVEHEPKLGVVAAPAQGIIFWGIAGIGAIKGTTSGTAPAGTPPGAFPDGSAPAFWNAAMRVFNSFRSAARTCRVRLRLWLAVPFTSTRVCGVCTTVLVSVAVADRPS